MGLVYFVPAGSRPLGALSARRLRDLGLDIADGEPWGHLELVAGGPNGAGGALVARGGAPEPLTAFRVEHWHPVVGANDGIVVGVQGDPPSPADLLRPDALDGHPVRLGDGQEWTVPLARGWADVDGSPVAYNALPHASVPTADGSGWTSGPMRDRYGPLWEIAERFADAVLHAMQSGDGAITLPEYDLSTICRDAACVLSCNYHVGPSEIGALGLFDAGRRAAADVLFGAIDWPTFIEWGKAREARAATDGSDTVDGATAATRTIDRVAQR